MSLLSNHPLLKLILVLVLISLAVLLWLGFQIRSESEYHELHYQVSVFTRSPLGNVTLLLPVPFVNGSSPLGEALVGGEGYGIPPDWRLSLEYVNDTPMLKVEVPRIIPEYHGYPIPLEEGKTPVQTPPTVSTECSEETPVLMPLQFGISHMLERTIDTRDPIGHEPLLSSQDLVKPIPCRDVPHTGECYQYPAQVFARYSTTGAGNITLSVSAGGMNQWWLGGWTGNSYDDWMEVTLVNGQQGWIQGEGHLSAGEGCY